MSYDKKTLAVGCHICRMSGIYIEEENSERTVFSNGVGGEEKSLNRVHLWTFNTRVHMSLPPS